MGPPLVQRCPKQQCTTSHQVELYNTSLVASRQNMSNIPMTHWLQAWIKSARADSYLCCREQSVLTLCAVVPIGGAGPMARLKAAASMRQQLQPVQQAPVGDQPYKHVPARLPPSHKAINEWLDAESALYAPAASASGAAAAQAAAAGSGFVMDANTGRLVPLRASAAQVSAACYSSNISSRS